MTICLTLTCKKCRREFHATFDDEEVAPDTCSDCKEESDETAGKTTWGLDGMSKLIVPGADDLKF
jgi:hypothetical protein